MYTKNFNQAFDLIMKFEVGGWFNSEDPATKQGLVDTKENRRKCGYVNDPNDNGGETKFGIAESSNPDLNIKTLTLEQAMQRYYDHYWMTTNCNSVPNILNCLYFDAVVHSGSNRATKWLQEAMGMAKVDIDGSFGPKTRATVKMIGNVKDISKNFLQARKNFLLLIVKKNPSQEKFLKGWLSRISALENWLSNQ